METQHTNTAPCALIVEDEFFVRFYGADLLTEIGFVVLQAGDAREALRLLEIRKDISLVFSDVQMPGAFDGLELARLIHRRWPQIALLITSGRPISSDQLPSSAGFLPKPYDGKALAHHIAQLWRMSESAPSVSLVPSVSATTTMLVCGASTADKIVCGDLSTA